MAFYADNYTIIGGNTTTQDPKNWTLQGSQDGTSWTTIDTVTNSTGWGAGESRNFTIDSPGTYTYYKLNVTANNGHASFLGFRELTFYNGLVQQNATMTGASAPAPNIITASSFYVAYDAYKAFDGVTAHPNSWLTNSTTTGWITFDTGVVVASLTPNHGIVGATVTIAGGGFGNNQGGSTVTFNGTAVTQFNSWSATSIEVEVPVGATTGNVVVTVGGVASAGVAFTVHPYISSLTPDEGEPTDHFIIAGSDFGAVQGGSTVTLNGAACSTTNWADDEIEVVVPAGATDGNVVVTVGGNASNGVAFDVLPNTPEITDVSPGSAYRGQEITVTGTQFGAVQGTSVITVRGVTASVVSWGATEIVCTVPVAATTGNVVVTTSAGASNGYALTVLIPVITEVAPNMAYEADHVTVTGTLFGAQVNGTLTVGSETITTLDIISWSTTEIVFQVPSTIVSGAVKVTSYSSVSNGVALTIHGTGEMRCLFVDRISGQTCLNLNDKVYYWYLDGSDFPLPPILNEMTSNAMSDGKRLVSSRYDDFTVTLKLLIKGDSPDDLDSRRRTLFAQLVKPNWLEFRPWGASDSVFYRTRPITSKHADWLKKFIRDWHYDTNVTVEIPVSDKVYGAERELAIANLIANPVFGSWTTGSPYDTPDDWTVTTDGTGTVEEETTDYYDPVSQTSCKLTTLDGDDVAQIESDAVIVDATLHYNPKVRAMKLDGTGSLSVDLMCYDADDVYLGAVSLVTDDDPDDTEFRDVVELADTGVVEPTDFVAGTRKASLLIKQEGAAGAVAIGAAVLICSENIIGNEYQGVMGINFEEGDFEGDRPAFMDIIVSPVVKPFTNLVIGQHKPYSDAFDPVQVPTGGTPVVAGTRYRQSYKAFDPGDPLVENGSFEDPEVSTVFNGDNTDQWHAFTAYRNGTNTHMESSTADPYIGTYHVALHNTVPGGTWSFFERLLTDPFAVDVNDTFYSYFFARKVYEGVPYNYLRAYFYDVGDNLLGYKELYKGILLYTTGDYGRFGGYVFPADFPDGTTQIRLFVMAKGTNAAPGGAPYPGSLFYWDALCWGSAISFGEVAFNLDGNVGWHRLTAGMSVSDDTPGSGLLTVQSNLAHATQGDISSLKSETTCDIGDPDTKFKEVILLSDRWDRMYTPSHHVSEQADKSVLEQVHRLLTDANFDATRDVWIDHFAKIFDEAYSKVDSWQGGHLILDSRSANPAVLTSLDGTYDTAQIYDATFNQGPPEFEADPVGVNLTLLQVYDNDDDQELTPISDITIRYNPVYLLTS